jgi:lysozyme
MKNFKTHLEEKSLLGSIAALGMVAGNAYGGNVTKPEALELATSHIKSFESFRSKAYVDTITKGKPLAIGYGITSKYPDGSTVKSTDTVTEKQAHDHLKQHIDKHVLPKLEKIPGWGDMNHSQQASLIGFAYNTGGSFYGSKGYETISKHLRSKNWDMVDDAIHLYNKSDGQVRNGLVRRRKMEADMWNGGVQSNPPATTPQNRQDTLHHTVGSGDNLSKIAKKYNTTVNDIVEKNPHLKTNPDKINPGQKIRIK